jgi:hypothetical protein
MVKTSVLQKRFESFTTFQHVLVRAMHLVLCILYTNNPCRNKVYTLHRCPDLTSLLVSPPMTAKWISRPRAEYNGVG